MSAKITAALHQVMTKVGYIQRTGHNKFHGYKYAGEADLLEKLRPAMLEAGLILLPSVESVTAVDEHGNTTVRIAYTLVHKDGDVWPDKICAAGCGNDKNSKGGVGDKGVYKAITGANKYLLFKLFQIETGDDPEHEELQQTNVTDEREHKAVEPAPPPPAPSKTFAELKDSLGKIEDITSLDTWTAKANEAKQQGLLRPSETLDLRSRLEARRSYLAQAPKSEAA